MAAAKLAAHAAAAGFLVATAMLYRYIPYCSGGMCGGGGGSGRGRAPGGGGGNTTPGPFFGARPSVAGDSDDNLGFLTPPANWCCCCCCWEAGEAPGCRDDSSNWKLIR